MTYTVLLNGTEIWDSSNFSRANALIDPIVKQEMNKSGTFTFTVLPGNTYYNDFRKLVTYIKVKRDSEVIFDGRVLYSETDFWRKRKVTCEGALSFLVDTVQPPLLGQDGEGEDMLPSELFSLIIGNHDAQLESDANRQISVGEITMSNSYFISKRKFKIDGYGNSLNILQSALLDSYGGWVQVRTTADNHKHLDWLDLDGNWQVGTQYIELGKNLVDFSEENSDYNVFTSIVPIGKDGITLDGYVKDGTTYGRILDIDSGVLKYGRIMIAVDFNEAETQEALFDAASTYIAANYFEPNSEPRKFSVKAVDLHIIDPIGYQAIKVGTKVMLVLPSHEINDSYYCVGIEHDLMNPQNTTYTLTTKDGVPNFSASGRVAQASANITNLANSVTDQANNIYKKLTDAERGLETILEVTAEGIKASMTDSIRGLKGHISATAEAFTLAYQDELKSLSSTWRFSAEGLSATIRDTSSRLQQDLIITASGIEDTLVSADGNLRNYFNITADGLHAELTNAANGLSNIMNVTAEGINVKLDNTKKSLSSELDYTAEHLKLTFDNTAKGLSSMFERTAEHMVSEFTNTALGLSSTITQTAAGLTATFSDSIAGTNGKIEATANALTSTYTSLQDEMTTVFTQTASYIDLSATKITEVEGIAGLYASDIKVAAEGIITRARYYATEYLDKYYTDTDGNRTWYYDAANSQFKLRSDDSVINIPDNYKTNAAYETFVANNASEVVIGAIQGLAENDDRYFDKDYLSKAGSFINVTKNDISLKADRIELDGFVKLTEGSLNVGPAVFSGKVTVGGRGIEVLGGGPINALFSKITGNELAAPTVTTNTLQFANSSMSLTASSFTDMYFLTSNALPSDKQIVASNGVFNIKCWSEGTTVSFAHVYAIAVPTA